MENLKKLLEQKIIQDIPLTNHMGLHVIYYDGHALHLSANLEKNINHRQTAFGGSITSLATLSGWGLIYLKLHTLDIQARIVIQEGSTKYLKPVTEDFDAICKIEDSPKFDHFINTLNRKGLARIKLTAHIICGSDTKAEFSGVFVAKKY